MDDSLQMPDQQRTTDHPLQMPDQQRTTDHPLQTTNLERLYSGPLRQQLPALNCFFSFWWLASLFVLLMICSSTKLVFVWHWPPGFPFGGICLIVYLSDVYTALCSVILPGRVLPYLGIVGRFYSDDPHFWDFESDWVPFLSFIMIWLTPSFCRKNQIVSITCSSRDTRT